MGEKFRSTATASSPLKLTQCQGVDQALGIKVVMVEDDNALGVDEDEPGRAPVQIALHQQRAAVVGPGVMAERYGQGMASLVGKAALGGVFRKFLKDGVDRRKTEHRRMAKSLDKFDQGREAAAMATGTGILKTE